MIPVNVRILVCTEPVDMRRGFDSLAQLARDKLQQDPRSGALLIFTGRRRDRLKALWWDRNGYCVLYKRFTKLCSSCLWPLKLTAAHRCASMARSWRCCSPASRKCVRKKRNCASCVDVQIGCACGRRRR